MPRLRLSHWGGSAALHGGLLLALLAAQAALHTPPAEKVIEWDVSVLEAAPPHAAPNPQPAPAKPSPPQHTPAPRPQPSQPTPVAQPTPPAAAPSVTSTPTPIPTPAVVKAPPPPPVEAPPEKPLADSSWLTHTLWGMMNGHKRYPLQARRMGAEGKVIIEAEIDERGEIIRAEIKQSAGSAILDQDALNLLKSVTPLKVDKMRLAARTKVQIPVSYVLE
jgi:protein TonB